MRACIHRGSQEVGGSCVEFEADGWRIVLDVGLPLDAEPEDAVALPDIRPLREPEAGPAAVFISHGHPDHYGLLGRVDPRVALFMGEGANRILREASFFTHGEPIREPTDALRDQVSIQFGPFIVTPYLADHSGFDSYSLRIDAGARSVLYTGDLRAHGRKQSAFQRLLSTPYPIHALLLEGTHVREEEAAAPLLTEAEVEDGCVERFRDTRGLVLACYSPQNIDRLVTMFKAARRAGRELVMDLYAATIASAAGKPTIPVPAWDGVRVYLPRSQRQHVQRTKEFHRVAAFRRHRIYPEEIAARSGELVFSFRHSMARELEQVGCLEDARCLWAMWPGYLQRESGQMLRFWLDGLGLELDVVHASGHASVEDLRRLVDALDPDRVIPIHTSAPERFAEHFPRVERHRDGEWWDV